MSTIIKCPKCQATLDQTETVCPYCETLLTHNFTEKTEKEPYFNVIKSQKNAENLKRNFSVGIFVFLLITFWPFAILYYLTARQD